MLQLLNIQFHKVVLLLDEAVKSEKLLNFDQAKIVYKKLSQEMLKLDVDGIPDNLKELFIRVSYAINKNLFLWDSIVKLYCRGNDYHHDNISEEVQKLKKVLIDRPEDVPFVFEPNRAIYFRIFFQWSWGEFRKQVYKANDVSKDPSMTHIQSLWQQIDAVFGYLFYSTSTAVLNSERFVIEGLKVYAGYSYEERFESKTEAGCAQCKKEKEDSTWKTNVNYTAK